MVAEVLCIVLCVVYLHRIAAAGKSPVNESGWAGKVCCVGGAGSRKTYDLKSEWPLQRELLWRHSARSYKTVPALRYPSLATRATP